MAFDASEAAAPTVDDPRAAARKAGLRYVNDDEPGYRRKRAGKGFAFYDPDGGLERNRSVIARLRALAVPPAWRAVWMCADPVGHIQASARDAKGRKQYRYHPAWRSHRDEVKFERMPWFGGVLPVIRERIAADLVSKDPELRVFAAIADLLDLGALRVGSSFEYDGAGAATLKKRHVLVHGARLRLKFRGKGGIAQDIALKDRRLARVVKALSELPGQSLFQIEGEHGRVRPVSSSEVNQYLREIAGAWVTAKEFRTWAAGASATAALLDDTTEPTVKSVLAAAAHRLGNTPAVCRKSYVHPVLIEMAHARERPPLARAADGLDAPEATFLSLIKR